MGTKKRLVRRKPAEEAVILITVPSEAEARKIAQALVGERLAACVNIIPGVRSIYFWQGKVCDDSEFLLVCKSRGPLLEPMMRRAFTATRSPSSSRCRLPPVPPIT